MKINPIANNLNFGRVIAVAGKDYQIQELNDNLENRGDIISLRATHLYQNEDREGMCTKAAKKGDEICFIMTGEDTKNATNYKKGWRTLEDLSNHISGFIQLRQSGYKIDPKTGKRVFVHSNVQRAAEVIIQKADEEK